MTIKGYSKFFGAELPLAGIYERTNYNKKTKEYYTTPTPIYYDAMPYLAEIIKKRTDEEYQTVVFCAGSTGSGKSNIGIMLCRALEEHWNVEKNYVLTKKKLFENILAEESKIVLIDEASLMLNSKNGMRSDDKSIEVLFDIIRSWSRVTVMCAPDEKRVNHAVVDTHVDILLKVPEESPIKGVDRRGFCDVYTKIRRDWGAPAHQFQCTILVDKMSGYVKNRYDRVKKQTQKDFLIQELAKCG